MNDLSIVIPCTHSTAGFPAFFEELASYLMANPSDTDVVIVTNGGDQHLEAAVAFMRERYPWVQCSFLERIGAARRFGALARFGIAWSTSRSIVLVSPYGGDDLAALPAMVAELRKGAQVAQATRYANAADATRVSRRFRCYQHLYRACIRLFLGHAVADSTYGYKAFDRVYLLALGLTQNGYALCPEITLKAILGGGRVAYVPSAPRHAAASGFLLLRDGPAYAWIIVRGAAHRVGIPWF